MKLLHQDTAEGWREPHIRFPKFTHVLCSFQADAFSSRGKEYMCFVTQLNTATAAFVNYKNSIDGQGL